MMGDLILANMDLVFFVYGAAFVMLGLTALWSPAEHSDHPIAAELGWLGAFGLSHGLNEWVDMWRLVQGGGPPAPLPLLLLAGSFACLLEFGRRLLRHELAPGATLRGLGSTWIYLPLALGLLTTGLLATDPMAGLAAGARYFLGFPAALLAAAALALGARRMATESPPMALAAYVAGGAMAAYAVLSGLVVGPVGLAPARVFNTELFQAAIGLPVQLFRAAVAVVLAVSLGFLFRRFNAEIRDKLAQLATTFRTSQAIMITDADEVIERVNPAFTRTTGYRPEEVIGRRPNLLQSGLQDDQFYQAMWHQLHSHGYWEGEIWNRVKDGRVIPIYEAISAIPDHDGVAGYVSVFHDISRQKELEAELERQATYDHLTNLYKRKPLEQFLAQEIRRAARFTTPFALIMLDIDRFKAVNDTYGHDFGDEILKELARVLQDHARETDILARWGGEEFMLLLPDTTSEGAHHLAERLRREVASTVFPEIGHITISLGVTPFHPGESTKQLLRRVDEALYQAKESGRNRMVLRP